MAKYIVVRFIKGSKRLQKTYWTDADAPTNKPKSVPYKEAERALAIARKTYPNEVYKLLKVEGKWFKAAD